MSPPRDWNAEIEALQEAKADFLRQGYEQSSNVGMVASRGVDWDYITLTRSTRSDVNFQVTRWEIEDESLAPRGHTDVTGDLTEALKEMWMLSRKQPFELLDPHHLESNPRQSSILGWAPEQYDQEQLRRGIQVELEHTDDPVEAQLIAMDHLAEQVLAGLPQDYYTRLDRMEESMLPNAKLTFPAARSQLFEYLRGQGWQVRSDLKVPYATSPDGELRLWFKPQAVWFTKIDDPRQRHDFKAARTIAYEFDIRELSPEQVVVEASSRAGYIPNARGSYDTVSADTSQGDFVVHRTVPYRYDRKTGAVQLRYDNDEYYDHKTRKFVRDAGWVTVARTKHASEDPAELARVWLANHDLELFVSTGSEKIARDARDYADQMEDERRQAGYAEFGYEENRSGTMSANRQWTTAYINRLPDSAFAYIEPGGHKDASGRTVPRSLRHLPYQDGSHRVDVDHLRVALARLNQVEGMSAAQERSIRRKLEGILARHGGYARNPQHIPPEVELYYQEVRSGNPSYSEAQSWATAWSIYCRHTNPKSTSCHRPASTYLTNHDLDYARAMEIANIELSEGRSAMEIVQALRRAGFNDDVFNQAIAIGSEAQWRQRNQAIERGPTVRSSARSLERAAEEDPFWRSKQIANREFSDEEAFAALHTRMQDPVRFAAAEVEQGMHPDQATRAASVEFGLSSDDTDVLHYIMDAYEVMGSVPAPTPPMRHRFEPTIPPMRASPHHFAVNRTALEVNTLAVYVPTGEVVRVISYEAGQPIIIGASGQPLVASHNDLSHDAYEIEVVKAMTQLMEGVDPGQVVEALVREDEISEEFALGAMEDAAERVTAQR